jgi:GxxExxY protein
MPEILLKDERYQLMGLLFEIHNKLGPIYKEINYQDAIEALLKRENLLYVREKKIPIMLDGVPVSDIFADFIIEDVILLEVKAKPFIKHEDIRQTSRMIRAEGIPLGIIANFKRNKLEYKRVINNSLHSRNIRDYS